MSKAILAALGLILVCLIVPNFNLTAGAGGITANGEIQSTSGGFRFPDGTVQTTAAVSVEAPGASANSGLYNNRIVLMDSPTPVTEICFKDGQVMEDIHSVAESTAGGSCLPGDIGWIIERDERDAAAWEIARAECLKIGMRLPEVFEYKFSCKDAVMFGLSDMTNGEEWASNTASFYIRDTSANPSGILVTTVGRDSCIEGFGSTVATNQGFENANAYRCLL